MVITLRDTVQAEKAPAAMLNTRVVRVVSVSLDLTNLTDMQRFANNLVKRLLPDRGAPNLLVENAGMVHLPVLGKAGLDPSITEDGFEHVYARNYLGHFLLMRLLTMPLQRTRDRIMLNSSIADSNRCLLRLLPSGANSVAKKSLEWASVFKSLAQYNNTKFMQALSLVLNFYDSVESTVHIHILTTLTK